MNLENFRACKLDHELKPLKLRNLETPPDRFVAARWCVRNPCVIFVNVFAVS